MSNRPSAPVTVEIGAPLPPALYKLMEASRSGWPVAAESTIPETVHFCSAGAGLCGFAGLTCGASRRAMLSSSANMANPRQYADYTTGGSEGRRFCGPRCFVRLAQNPRTTEFGATRSCASFRSRKAGEESAFPARKSKADSWGRNRPQNDVRPGATGSIFLTFLRYIV